MKNRFPLLAACFFRSGLLAGAAFLGLQTKLVSAQPLPDPAHAAHVAAGTMPPAAAIGDPGLAQQIAELRAKVTQLEATLAKSAPPLTAPSSAAAMSGMPAVSPPSKPPMGMDKMKSGGGSPAMRSGDAPAPPMTGMSDPTPPTGSMMGMMSQMMRMMDKMMPVAGGGAPMPSGGTMPAGGMGMDMTKMSGSSPMPPPSAGGMAADGGMMDMMDMMGMMGMMGMGGGGNMAAMPQSALPGFPGASHLYHIGGTGFFLDHPQHLALTTEQQAALNKAKEQALLGKSTADRAIEQSEQGLWVLTAADQPDATKIEAKIREVEKLRGDERLAFIRAVGDASKILTDEQRKILTGFAPVASADPAAAPMSPGMKDM